MNDLEITRLCADAMNIQPVNFGNGERYVTLGDSSYKRYDPLHDDAQAMGLVKKMGLDIHCRADLNGWYVGRGRLHESLSTHPDLNRAICYAVAAVQTEAA